MAVFIHLVGLLDSGQPLAFSTSPTSLYLRHEAKEPKKNTSSFFVSLWSLFSTFVTTLTKHGLFSFSHNFKGPNLGFGVLWWNSLFSFISSVSQSRFSYPSWVCSHVLTFTFNIQNLYWCCTPCPTQIRWWSHSFFYSVILLPGVFLSWMTGILPFCFLALLPVLSGCLA